MNSMEKGSQQWSPLFRGPDFRDDRDRAWGDVCSPTMGGIYRIVALESDRDFKSATIERLLGRDAMGTLYVGSAKNLCGRLGDVSRTLKAGINQNHRAAYRLFENAKLAQQFPIRKEAITWRYDDDPARADEEFTANYKMEFGETPPLNEQ